MVLMMAVTGRALSEGLVYIRVVGRDDTAAGQAEKMRVRSCVLPLCPADPADLISALPRIAKAARAIAPCRVSLRPWRPGSDLPAAMTLYITIGPGQGHNWWGVLYAGALDMARAGDSQQDSAEVRFVWPLWDWLKGLLGLA